MRGSPVALGRLQLESEKRWSKTWIDFVTHEDLGQDGEEPPEQRPDTSRKRTLKECLESLVDLVWGPVRSKSLEVVVETCRKVSS